MLTGLLWELEREKDDHAVSINDEHRIVTAFVVIADEIRSRQCCCSVFVFPGFAYTTYILYNEVCRAKN